MKTRKVFCQSAHALPCFLANSNGGTLPDHKADILPHDRKRETTFYGYDLRVLFFGKLPPQIFS